MPTYSLILRDANYVRIDELGDWLSFSYVKRFNGVGTWELEVSNLSVSAPLIAKTTGIIVTRDGATIFSGSVATEYARTATTLRVAGYDDNVLLNVPMLPKVDGPPYTTEYDVRTAQASTVLIQVVQFNISPAGARPDRVIPELRFAPNPLLGGTVTSRGRFQNLIAYMADLASTPAAGGLGFDLLQTDGDDTLTFRVYEPPDRRADAVFSIESLTAEDYEDVYTHPPYNKVYVLLGDGLGSNRSVVEAEDAAAIAEVGRRIETVIDARDVSDPGEGNQRAAEALAGAVSSRRVTVEPFQLNTLEFGTDYDLGDLVSFVIDGEVFDEVIREVQVEFTLDRGVVVTPSIGNGADPDDDAAVNRQIASVDLRLTNIERNYSVPDDSIVNAMLTAASVRPANLDAINSPSDGLIPVYDAGTLEFEWIAADSLIDDLHLTSLTVTGPATLAATTASTLTASSTVQGTQLISTVLSPTPPLQVSSNVEVLNLNAARLQGHPASDFALATALASYLPLTGGTLSGGLQVQGLLQADGSVTLGNSSGDLVTVIGTATFSQTPLFNAQVDVQGGTAGQVRAGTLLANATSPSGSEHLRVGGSSRLEGSVTVTSGGIGVTGSSIFSSGLTVQNGLTVQTGGLTVSTNSFVVGTNRFEVNGTGLGFFGSAPVARPTVVGSRAGNAALNSLCSELANLGLITNMTTA